MLTASFLIIRTAQSYYLEVNSVKDKTTKVKLIIFYPKKPHENKQKNRRKKPHIKQLIIDMDRLKFDTLC